MTAGQTYDFAAEFGVPYRPWLDRLDALRRADGNGPVRPRP
ncbi:hypothetical protein [Streptomyces sp. NBC_01353]|nr:hypothetical protein [Streptomyces sp. NBC_01353]